MVRARPVLAATELIGTVRAVRHTGPAADRYPGAPAGGFRVAAAAVGRPSDPIHFGNGDNSPVREAGSMRCNHCGSAGGTERRVRFTDAESTDLVLCPDCITEFEREDSVASVHTLLAR